MIDINTTEETKPKPSGFKGIIAAGLIVVILIILHGVWLIISSPEFACESGRWRYNEYDKENDTYCSLMMDKSWDYPLVEFCARGKPDFVNFTDFHCVEAD